MPTNAALSANHFTLTSANHVFQIAEKFMQHFNLRYFNYGRIYANGHSTLLATDPAWVRHYLKSKYPIGGKIISKGIYPWQINLPRQAILDARNDYNIDNGVTEVIEQAEYIEFYDFASTAGDEKALYYQLNHHDLYLKFLDYFKHEAKSLIHESYAHPIATNIKKSASSFDQLNVNQILDEIGCASTMLSQRQKDCLSLLAKGYTYKLIGRQLGISMRTVEHYLETARQKLGCHRRFELIAYAQKIER